MWEITLFIIVAFMSGWFARGIVGHRKRPLQAEEPELMWFNDKKSRWERVTSMHLSVADKAVVIVPVKLVNQSEEYEDPDE